MAAISTAVTATALALSIALGATMGIVGGVQAQQAAEYNADSAEAQAQAQQQLMDYNAKMAEREAGYATDEARRQEQLQRRENSRLLSAQRSLYGKSGVLLTEGTPLAVLGDSAANGELAALEVRRQGEIERNRQLMIGQNYTYQGNVAHMIGKSESSISRWQGRNANVGGYMQAGQSLLSGASQAYGSGMFGGKSSNFSFNSGNLSNY